MFKQRLLCALQYIHMKEYYILLYFSQCQSDITQFNIFIFLHSSLLLLDVCMYCSELLDTTALLELGTQAIRYTHNNIC
jgi:hypothetical protein